MKSVMCGTPKCENRTRRLAIVRTAIRDYLLPRCEEHMAKWDDYEVIQ